MAEEELEEVDLGSDSQKPRPISISASLTETEKSELILLLKNSKTSLLGITMKCQGSIPGLLRIR